MKVARAISPRSRWRDYGAHGLICVRCDSFFRTATEFVKHHCWRLMLEQAERQQTVSQLLSKTPPKKRRRVQPAAVQKGLFDDN